MKYLLIILLSFFGLSGYSQLMQTNGTEGGYQFVALKSDSLHIIPRGSDTPNIGGTKYGKSTVGAMFYKTTDSTLWIRSANKWNQVTGTGSGGSGISSLGQGYGVVIVNDSTYNVDSSLFISVQHFYNTIDSVINTISSSGIDSIVVNSPLAIDFTNRQIPVISYTGDTTRYFIFEAPIQANVYGDTVYVYLDSTGNGDYSIAHHSFGYYLGVFLTSAQAANTYITYDSAQGRFVDTGYSRTDSFFLVKNGVEFLQGIAAGSAGDTTVFETVIDSTGQAGQRVLFSGGDGHIKSDAYFLYDSVRNKLVINHRNVSVGGNGIKLWVQGDTYLNGNLGLFAPTVQTDTALYKPLVISPNTAGGSVFRLNRWPVVNDPSKLSASDTVNLSYRIDSLSTHIGSGGSGSVEYAVSGLGIRVDSSARVYTVNLDTASGVVLSRQRAAATYAPLIRTISTGWGIYGGGDFSADRTHVVDSFLVTSRDRLLKVIDSLVAIIATKQAQLNGTGYVKMSGTTPSYQSNTQLTADVNTFTQTLSGAVPAPTTLNGYFLKDNGTWAAASGAGAVTGSGASPQVAYWSGTSALTGISRFTYTNGSSGVTETNDLGLGTGTPYSSGGYSFISASGPSGAGFNFQSTGGNIKFRLGADSAATSSASMGTVTNHNFTLNTNNAGRLRIYDNGDVAIGTVFSRLNISSYTSLYVENTSGSYIQAKGGGRVLALAADNTDNIGLSGSNHQFYIKTNSVVRMSIPTTGEVLINSSTSIPSSQFSVVTTTKGAIPNPLMTTTQRNAISSPATGLKVYNSTLKYPEFYDGATWQGQVGMTFGTAAPSSTPSAVGNFFLDTTNKKLYVSTGTASSADWNILN